MKVLACCSWHETYGAYSVFVESRLVKDAQGQHSELRKTCFGVVGDWVRQ